MADRYSFFNFTTEPFMGRYGGVDYSFSPSETREFDPDKHYMLILMAKQLADRELLKKQAGVGRNPNDLNTFGKALDAEGNLFVITTDNRRTIMKKAIGELLDTPVPIPEVQTEEAGATKEVNENIKEMKQEIRDLKDIVNMFVSKQTVQAPSNPPANGKLHSEPSNEPSMVMTRDALESIAKDKGIVGYEAMSKEKLIQSIAV